MQQIVQCIAKRVGKLLEKRGLIQRDMESSWLARDGQAGLLDELIGHSITYLIAVGPRAGQKLFTLQTLPATQLEEGGEEQGAAQRGAAVTSGFSWHAGIDIQPGQRQKLERLWSYVSRPPMAVERMALTSSSM